MNLKETLNKLCEQQRDYGERVGWEANTHGGGKLL